VGSNPVRVAIRLGLYQGLAHDYASRSQISHKCEQLYRAESFVLSDFPPTQRFGLVVLAGCIIDILANLFVLPLLGGAPFKLAWQRASQR
jgi:hypothetical protein